MNTCNICLEEKKNFVGCGTCKNEICIYCFANCWKCPYCRQVINTLKRMKDVEQANEPRQHRQRRVYTPEQTAAYNERRRQRRRR